MSELTGTLKMICGECDKEIGAIMIDREHRHRLYELLEEVGAYPLCPDCFKASTSNAMFYDRSKFPK